MDTQESNVVAAAGIPMPALGAPLAGGRFAGIVLGDKPGDPDEALVDLGFADRMMTWREGEEYAAAKSARQPSREEARILWANLDARSKESRGWFWLRTQYEGFAVYAWVQGFGGGTQSDDHKDGEGHVRAVRRLPLQSFSDSVRS